MAVVVIPREENTGERRTVVVLPLESNCWGLPLLVLTEASSMTLCLVSEAMTPLDYMRCVVAADRASAFVSAYWRGGVREKW